MRSLLVTVFVLTGLSCFKGVAQGHVATAIVRETMLEFEGKSTFVKLWWIPTAFWELTWPIPDDPETQAYRIHVLEELAHLYLFAMVGSTGKALDAKECSATLSTTHALHSIPVGSLDTLVRRFIERARPMLVNTMGFPENEVQLAVFTSSGKSENSLRPAVLEETGQLTLAYRNETYSWAVPPMAMRPALFCPVDGNVLEPGWRFCPWHGVELQSLGDVDQGNRQGSQAGQE